MTDEVKAPKLAIGQQLFFVACALLVGFIAGRAVAEAAGAIPAPQKADEVWIIFPAQCLLGLFVYAALRFLLQLGQRMVAILAGVHTRPSSWVAVAIIGFGVLCLLAAVALQWHESANSASVSASLPSFQMSGLPQGQTFTGGVAIRGRTSLMAPVTTIGVLLAGLVIIGIGIWSSIPPRPISASMLNGSTQGIRAETFAAADRPRE